MDLQVIQVKGFHPSQPNDHTSANYVTLWKQFHGYWDDEVCSCHYRFICERTKRVSNTHFKTLSLLLKIKILVTRGHM